MAQLQVQVLQPCKLHYCKLTHTASFSQPPIFKPNYERRLMLPRRTLLLYPPLAVQSRTLCKMNGSDMISQLELGKSGDKRKPEKRVSGIFWIILLNIGVYVADHFFQVRSIKTLYLYHNWPAWYQFLTATFCHANWNHLSSNLFFLYIFGKLVEEEEGNFALWLSYILTGAGANLVSWLVLPRSAVSVGASGAVFGLFTISVLVKVMEAAQASTALPGTFRGGYLMQSVNHIAHLSGALVGVLLVWLLSKVPSDPSDQVSTLQRKTGRTP
ncbi:rhomboid-like protein 11, chloroplastic isoform X3 [Neltuma alba]|uniref:rhomboid-like protein 11, chloroplastic isoform X3 n=1 Tax=Neltuma alba TaxID=207710 RepID=UPI0010A40789|nr:rhomboid-like protein 11, chloroplastic isoform X3 [Prosopis alba]